MSTRHVRGVRAILVVGIEAPGQFQPHAAHFQESVAACFAMALPQRGQMRIQIRFVIAISTS